MLELRDQLRIEDRHRQEAAGAAEGIDGNLAGRHRHPRRDRRGLRGAAVAGEPDELCDQPKVRAAVTAGP
ncbi:hypothetical protein [Kribbella qitaiheensis]|uniref:hypothetical protein n=1 Tax=Kribbella qitaiheensis TaxID=1544730 RepID=UPI0016233321|nr:hypothetical protein [Kribbella qitaiheensis]